MLYQTTNETNQQYLEQYEEFKMEQTLAKNGNNVKKARDSINQYISKTRKLMDYIGYDVAELTMADLMEWAEQITTITGNRGNGGTNAKSLNHIRGFLKDLIRINVLDCKDRMSKEILFYLATN